MFVNVDVNNLTVDPKEVDLKSIIKEHLKKRRS